MEKVVNKLLIFLFIISLLVPRFFQIERPITVDELTWLTFSSDFLYGLAGGEFEHTYQDHHPGVTTMMAGTLAFVLEDKSYRAVQGYVENDTFLLIERLEEKGFSLFDVLVTARRLMALASSAILVLSFWFLWRAWGGFPAWVVIMFVIMDPMVIGQTRLYSHEGLMSSLVFLTWISFYYYVRHGRSWSALIISGASMGFAWLTKITALGLVPVVGLILLVDIFHENKSVTGETTPIRKPLFAFLKTFSVWMLVAILVFLVSWPAVLSNPIETLTHMVNHTLNFAGVGGDSVASGRNFTNISNGIIMYIHSIWTHTTLITWFGNLIVLAALIFSRRIKKSVVPVQMAMYLYLFIGILIVALGGMGSFRADRYMASAHFFIALLGGMGILILIDWLTNIRWIEHYRWFSLALAGVILLFQVVIILPARPYYYTYLNPLEGNVWWGAHGAFLDQAADYLAEKPDAESLSAMTFSPGSFMYFFPGETFFIKSTPDWGERDAGNLRASDYLVINFELTNLSAPPRIISEIVGVDPEYVISYQGHEYVWIYRVEDLPDSVFIPDPD